MGWVKNRVSYYDNIFIYFNFGFSLYQSTRKLYYALDPHIKCQSILNQNMGWASRVSFSGALMAAIFDSCQKEREGSKELILKYPDILGFYSRYLLQSPGRFVNYYLIISWVKSWAKSCWLEFSNGRLHYRWHFFLCTVDQICWWLDSSLVHQMAKG